MKTFHKYSCHHSENDSYLQYVLGYTMRWNEILEDANVANLSFDQLWTGIEYECSDILQVMKSTKKALYRGQWNNEEPYFKKAIRSGREPLNTPSEIHHAIENWMAQHGFAARRSNSLFTSSNRAFATNYGHPYMILPKNGFSFSWFENSQDLYVSINEFLDHDGGENFTQEDIQTFLRNIDEFMERADPHHDDLPSALAKGNEVMITGVEYYAIDAREYEADVWRMVG